MHRQSSGWMSYQATLRILNNSPETMQTHYWSGQSVHRTWRLCLTYWHYCQVLQHDRLMHAALLQWQPPSLTVLYVKPLSQAETFQMYLWKVNWTFVIVLNGQYYHLLQTIITYVPYVVLLVQRFSANQSQHQSLMYIYWFWACITVKRLHLKSGHQGCKRPSSPPIVPSVQ